MEAIYFIAGFALGAIVVFGILFITQKKSDVAKNEMLSKMQLEFENLTNRLFKENSEEFSNQNKEKLEQFFQKFKERIEDFEKRTETNFKEELENFTKFDTNIKAFIEAGSQISRDANTLSSIMKNDNRTQGKWGEIVLEKVLEASGLRKDYEYSIQKSSEEGRPDATVLLPEGRCVFIDAKTSISSWEKYINAPEEEKTDCLKAFIDSTKSHISNLAKRDYSDCEKSPDYVLMFIPIESCYSLMFCENNSLWEQAWKNKIMPVSPSTLLAALKIINAFHTVDKQNKNAIEISRLCAKSLDKFAEMLKDILDSRKKIDSALTKLTGRDNIITNIEKLKELGIKMNKDIPPFEDKLIEQISE